MAKISENRMQDKLERVYLLLHHHPDGLTEREIADEVGYERRSVNNYLQQLEREAKVEKEGTLWYARDYQRILPRRLEFLPDEAMILYLACRLFVKQNDRRNEMAEVVLMKLATVMSEDVRLGDDLQNAAHELAQRPKAPDYEDVFRTIIQAYIYRQQTRILYHPYRGEPFETNFAPYLLEPSAIGFSNYAIGFSSIVNGLRTYKIERILRANLTREAYEVPPDFHGLELLRNAWSIFYGEEVTRVVLRFNPDVSRRIQETHWHSSQRLTWDEEHVGYLLFTVEVADTTDLKPWIRTWGANCEVLEPASLRDEMVGEARRIAYLYGWRTSHEDKDQHNRFDDIFGS